MKKLLFLLATTGIDFFASCEKETPTPELEEEEPPKVHDTSLAGTTWRGASIGFPGGLDKDTLIFTGTTVNYSYYGEHFLDESMKPPPIKTRFSFSGTYTYYPPTITISVTSPDSLRGVINTGTLERISAPSFWFDGDSIISLGIGWRPESPSGSLLKQ